MNGVSYQNTEGAKTKNTELEQLINEKLNSAAISDYAPNGCRWKAKETVQKIVTGVTASHALPMRQCVWRGWLAIAGSWLLLERRVSGHSRNQAYPFKTLLANDINLYGWHLPLDAHPELAARQLAGVTWGSRSW
ncbi:Nif3-like dinuclear metal center hexameric protein [Shigella flexneri]